MFYPFVGISRSSVQRIAKSRGLQPKKKVRVHKIPKPKKRIETNEERRARCAEDLLFMCDSTQEDLVKNGVFSDQSHFQVCGPISTQNKRVYSKGKKSAIPAERLLIEQSNLTFEQKVMVYAAISWRGKVCLHIHPPNETIDHEVYIRLLERRVIPACERVYPELSYVYQQDGAPAHKDENTQEWLRRNTPAFIDKDTWPGYSPDLNVCDYRLWGWMKQQVYKGEMPKTIPELCNRIEKAWDELPTELIQKWISEFPARLQKVIDTKGTQIQQYFNKI